MTQAINLANFSNSLDISGQVSPSVLNAPVPLSKGGTNGTTAATARANLDVAQAVYSVPSGGIIMWSGSIASIPSGWYLCNGSNSTPDLRDRFIVGAGATYGVGAAGGSTDAIVVSHTHTANVSDPGHVHSYTNTGSRLINQGGNDLANVATPTGAANTGGAGTGISVTNTATGGSGSGANMPPYYALAYIMKS